MDLTLADWIGLLIPAPSGEMEIEAEIADTKVKSKDIDQISF